MVRSSSIRRRGLLSLTDLSPKPLRQGVLAQFPSGNLQSNDFQPVRSGQFLNAIEVKKHQQGHHRCPLISVYKGMILGEMEEICRGHRGDIFMEIITVELLARHRDGRIQKAMFPDTL